MAETAYMMMKREFEYEVGGSQHSYLDYHNIMIHDIMIHLNLSSMYSSTPSLFQYVGHS